MHNVLKIGDDLFLVKRRISIIYEPLASEWNEISPNYRTFKKNNDLYLCELVEDAIIEENVIVEEAVVENLENPII